ncbi:MAG: DUF1918 domain-containing protein [Actinomycetes bacterium]
MKASPGDRIIVHGRTLDDPSRDGRVLDVQGPDGSPPYWVEWSEDGHVSLFFPGPDADVKHYTPQP